MASKKKAAAKKRPKPKKTPARAGDWLVEVTPTAGSRDIDGAKLLAEARALGIDARAARSAVV